MKMYHCRKLFFCGIIGWAVSVSAGFAQTYPERVSADHPLVYWRFSNDLTDAQGNLDLMSPGTPAFVNGPHGGHLAFSSNGGTAWAAQFGVEKLSGLNDFTYELWINLAGDNEGKVIFERQALTNGDPGSGTHRIRYGGGKLFFEYTGAGSAPEAPSAELPNQTDAWHHIVLTSKYDAATNVLYVDGVAVFEGEAFLEPIFGGNQDVVYIGSSRSNPEGLIMNGYVDEVAIYDRTLSASEVTQHFQAALPDGYPGVIKTAAPLVYWRFENNFKDEMNLYNLVPTGANYVDGPGGAPNRALFSRVLNNQAEILYDNIESFTYEMWINCIFASVQSYILFRNPTGSQHAVIYAYNPDALEFFFLEGGARPLVTIPNQTDRWYHLAAVNDMDAGQMRFYLDGELALEHDGVAAPGAGNLVVVGGADLGANFNGYIDEVAMYDYALTAETIQTHFKAPMNGAPVIEWPLY
ncbi:MAG: LamG domain-containing protein [bacterium]